MAQLDWLTKHVDDVMLLWPGEARSKGRREDMVYSNKMAEILRCEWMKGCFFLEDGTDLIFAPVAKVNNANMYADATCSISSLPSPTPEDVEAPVEDEIHILNMCARVEKLKLKQIRRAAYQGSHNPEQDIATDKRDSDADNLELHKDDSDENDTAQMPAGFTMQVNDANLELLEYQKEDCAVTQRQVGRRREPRERTFVDSASMEASGAGQLQAMLWTGVLRRSKVIVLEKYEGRGQTLRHPCAIMSSHTPIVATIATRVCSCIVCQDSLATPCTLTTFVQVA